MKKLLFASLVALCPVAGKAYVCTQNNGKLVLKTVHPDLKTIQAGLYLQGASQLLVKFNGQVGNPTDVSSSLFKKISYDLVDHKGYPANLVIVKSSFMPRGGCGRGGCDPISNSFTSAKLSYGNQIYNFSCQ